MSTDLIYDRILSEQVEICYMCNGISITDTDEMSPYDRKLIYEKLQEIKKAEAEQFSKR